MALLGFGAIGVNPIGIGPREQGLYQPEIWTKSVITAETWANATKDAETWTVATKDVETWTPH